MTHVLVFLLCLVGFASLAFATRRPQRDLIGRSLRKSTISVLRIIGACALLGALGILVAWHGWSLGLVMFSGHTSVNAGIVYCALVGYSQMRP